jgi:DNA-binding MarR family transcriptional regulator
MGSRPRKPGRSESSPHVDYWTLAELRYSIRRFLRTRELAARAAGIAPQQYLVLLQLKGLEGKQRATVGMLAERLQLRHHTTVELVDRLVSGKLVAREPEGREVTVKLLPAAEAILMKLAAYSIAELQTEGPALVAVLQRLIREKKSRS